MKKIRILFVWLFIIILSGTAALAFGTASPDKARKNAPQEYLRLHIRANSDDPADQAVKYLVRDAVVRALTPCVAACNDKAAAMNAMQGELSRLEDVACAVLRQNGFSYGARAALRRETFPTRVYEDYTLAAGEYDALILELGQGAGENWWCCIYPPLCFTGDNAAPVYRSRIAELIENFFAEK